MIEHHVIDRLIWTDFSDTTAGGTQKTQFRHVYIQATGEIAATIFEERLGRSHNRQSCHCCGPDFSAEVGDGGLAEMTKWSRNVEISGGVEMTLDLDQEQIRLTDYCQRDDVLVIYTRERGEEI